MEKKILTVSNHKGGVAKSTTCAQIAAWTAKQGVRTLMIDLDPQSSLSAKFLTMGHLNDSTESIPEPHPDDQEVYTSRSLFLGEHWLPYKTATTNLSILPASGHMSRLDVYPKQPIAIQNVLKELDDPGVWEAFDLIVIDTPPAKNLYSETALRVATHTLIPCAMEKAPFEGLTTAVQFNDMVNKPLSVDDASQLIGVLPTLFRSSMRIHKDMLLRLEKSLPNMRFPMQVRFRPTYQEIDLEAKAHPYEIRKIKKTEKAYEEWKALGMFVMEKMKIEPAPAREG